MKAVLVPMLAIIALSCASGSEDSDTDLASVSDSATEPTSTAADDAAATTEPPTTTNEPPDSASASDPTDPEPASTGAPIVEATGPATPADTVGAQSKGGSSLTPQTENLPAEFDVLLSLFDLDGSIAVGYSPFDPPGNNCLEARFISANGEQRAAAAALTPGIVCDSFSPFVTSASPGELLICNEVLFLTTDFAITTLEESSSSIIATITSPAIPDGMNWIGGTFDGPIPATEFPTLDLSSFSCEGSPPPTLDADVPLYSDPVTQQVGIVEIDEGGVRASFTTIGEGTSALAGQYAFDMITWDVSVEGERVEAEHPDGRYLAFVPKGGPGPMTIELCVWPQPPSDTSCV